MFLDQVGGGFACLFSPRRFSLLSTSPLVPKTKQDVSRGVWRKIFGFLLVLVCWFGGFGDGVWDRKSMHIHELLRIILSCGGKLEEWIGLQAPVAELWTSKANLHTERSGALSDWGLRTVNS